MAEWQASSANEHELWRVDSAPHLGHINPSPCSPGSRKVLLRRLNNEARSVASTASSVVSGAARSAQRVRSW